MNNLPNEILHSIFILVQFGERLKCTLVCRDWYNVLYNGSLLYQIHFQNDDKFLKFIDMLQRLPNLASQVEIVNLRISTTIDKRILCNLLPNLRVFKYSSSSNDNLHKNNWTRSFKLITPNSDLRIIEDQKECELTRQLLIFGSCTRLTHLKLDLRCINNPRKEVFTHLKSVPALKILRLDYCDMGIEDLEIIHKNLPALKTLHVFGSRFISSESPSDVIPAATVNKFEMDIYGVKNHPDYLDYLDWYKYLIKKYNNLTSFKCSNPSIYFFQPNKVKAIHEHGILPLYKNNENHLRYFDASQIPTGFNVFNMMDEFGLQIRAFDLRNDQNVSIFEQLAGSNQSKYAESITLYQSAIASPMMLQYFTTLISLNISDCYRKPVNLIDYFNAFPLSLTSFKAFLPEVTIDSLPAISNNIEEFSLTCDTFTPKLGEAISMFFPKLNTLCLKGKITENLHINLPHNHFKRLEIQISADKDYFYAFSITDTKQPRPQYYIKKYLGEEEKKPTIAEDLVDRIIISLSYATVKRIRCEVLY